MSTGTGAIFFSTNGMVTTTVVNPGGTTFPVGIWVHWAFVFNESANTAELFMDGVSQGVVTHTAPYSASPDVLQLGRSSIGEVAPWGGDMDEFAVYERDLGSAAIADLAASGRRAAVSVQWAATGASATGGAVIGNTASLSGTWQRVSVTYTCRQYEPYVDFVLRQTTSVASAIRVATPAIYEGQLLASHTVPTMTGGVPALGWTGINDYIAKSAGWVITADTSSNPGTATHATSAAGGAPWIDFLLDGSSIKPPEFTTTTQIEVYAYLQVDAGMVGLRGYVQARPYDVFTPDPTLGDIYGWQYGQPYGATGHSIDLPSSAPASRIVKLGTITVDASGAFTDPLQLRIVFPYSSGATAGQSLVLNGLVLVPAHSRALLPTGKRNDSTYPHFMPPSPASTLVKVVRSDLTVEVGNLRTRAVGTGFGGSPQELPSGTEVDVFVFSTAGGVPDDPAPIANETQAYYAWNNDLHVAITPRYNLFAPAR
jgi:hypothetical protein